MGSDANNINDGTSFQPSEPSPCANGCGFFGFFGFFGAAATNGFCSKCFRDLRIKEEQAASAKAAVDKLVNKVLTFPLQPPSASSSGSEPVPTQAAAADGKVSSRCLICNKKVNKAWSGLERAPTGSFKNKLMVWD